MLDSATLQAIFTAPRIDGQFEGSLGDLAHDLGRRRPLVLLAFAPRSAGTFLRTAAITALDGQLMRFVHAEGGRDAVLYLPWLVAYYGGGLTKDTAVTHVHMQASAANRHLLDAFDIRPVVMLRSIPDMLASLWAMIEADNDVPLGFSFLMPSRFSHMNTAEKGDLLIDMMGPWYAQFYAGWKSYAAVAPGYVLILDYADFCAAPADALEAILAHARAATPFAQCQTAIDLTWQERDQFRCNRGRPRRLAPTFGAAQLDRLERFVSYYDDLAAWREVLLTPSRP